MTTETIQYMRRLHLALQSHPAASQGRTYGAGGGVKLHVHPDDADRAGEAALRGLSGQYAGLQVVVDTSVEPGHFRVDSAGPVHT